MISYTKDVIRGGDSRPGFSVYSPADSPVRALSYPWRAPGFSLWKSLELVAEVENLTLTDQLTGLPNRRALFQRLDSEDNRLNRYGGKMSIVMIDMTGFKEVNGTYGHLVGDSAPPGGVALRQGLLPRESVFASASAATSSSSLCPRRAEEAAVLQRADDRMYVEKKRAREQLAGGYEEGHPQSLRPGRPAVGQDQPRPRRAGALL